MLRAVQVDEGGAIASPIGTCETARIARLLVKAQMRTQLETEHHTRTRGGQNVAPGIGTRIETEDQKENANGIGNIGTGTVNVGRETRTEIGRESGTRIVNAKRTATGNVRRVVDENANANESEKENGIATGIVPTGDERKTHRRRERGKEMFLLRHLRVADVTKIEEGVVLKRLVVTTLNDLAGMMEDIRGVVKKRCALNKT